MSKINIIKETMQFLKLDNSINLDALFNDAKTNSDIENLVILWYNVQKDPGLSQMVLREIKINYGMAEKN